MSKRKLFTLLGSICLTLVLVALLLPACAPAPAAPTPAAPAAPVAPAKPAAPAEVYKWRCMTSYTPELLPGYAEIPDAVADATGGAMKIDIYYFGEHPFSGEDMWGALRDGKTEMASAVSSYISGADPVLGMMLLPFISTIGAEEFAEAWAILEPDLDKIMAERWNIKHLATYGAIGNSIISTFPATSEAALKGKKIRVCSREVGQAAAVMGCTPVTLAWGEVYTALQRGIIDGAIGSVSGAIGTRWQEPCKYITRWNYGGQGGLYAHWTSANLDALNELPSDIRADFVKCMAEDWGPWNFELMLGLDSGAVARSVDEFGCTIYPAMREMEAKIREVMRPIYQETADSDPVYGQHFLDVINEAYEKWAATL